MSSDYDTLGLADKPLADGILGKIQRVYIEELAKQSRPNKRWACKLLLSFAGGESLKSQQFPMAASALNLTRDEMEDLISIRGER